MIFIVLIVIVIALILFLKLRGKKTRISNETVVGYVGGLGSGKTSQAVNRAIKKWKENIKKWKSDKNGSPAPWLISNIPIVYKYKGKKYSSAELTTEILLMKKRIPVGSVVLIDEVHLIADQFSWKKENVKNELTEFISLYRQYTKGGYLILTDQTLDSIVKPIRDRINIISYCLKINWLGHLFCSQACILKFTQRIDSYSADSMNELITRNYGYMNKIYDTYAYYERYTELAKEFANCCRKDNLTIKDMISLNN